MTVTTTETLAQNVSALKLAAQANVTPATNGTNGAAAETKKAAWFNQTGLPDEAYPYAHLLPTYDKETTYAPLEEFEHVDPGLKAVNTSEPRAFLAGATIDDLSPEFGSEVEGIQLDKLDDKGREQLALYVAQRGVVAFRDQDFIDQDPEWQIRNWGSFFGRNHIHPTSGQPKVSPSCTSSIAKGLMCSRSFDKSKNEYDVSGRVSSAAWHSDVTYEKQPPGLTALFLYDSPAVGGDTAFVNQRAAYDRLSPSFKAYLETLKVLHSGVAQADYSRTRGGVVRREPVETWHPLVRRHPVTGDKALFVSRVFSRRIQGLKDEESNAILNFLYETIERGSDFQVRVRWKPRTVVLWDNRITAHSALIDFDKVPGARRHGARITPQAEVPFI